MGALVMAAIVAAADVATLPVREPAAAPPAPVFAMSVQTVEVGDGSALVQAGAGYAAGKSSVGLVTRWQRSAVRWLPDTAEVSFAVGRELNRRERIDLELWRGLTRFSGGTGVGITWSRTIGR
jgi:hypothetical protein